MNTAPERGELVLRAARYLAALLLNPGAAQAVERASILDDGVRVTAVDHHGALTLLRFLPPVQRAYHDDGDNRRHSWFWTIDGRCAPSPLGSGEPAAPGDSRSMEIALFVRPTEFVRPAAAPCPPSDPDDPITRVATLTDTDLADLAAGPATTHRSGA